MFIDGVEGVVYGKGIFLAFGGNHYLTSEDGVRWIVNQNPLSHPLSHLEFEDEVFLGQNLQKVLVSSTDGFNWDMHNKIGKSLWGFAKSETTWVTVGGNGAILSAEPELFTLSELNQDPLWEEIYDLTSGWKESSWYGVFFDSLSPWTYHLEHGFQFISREQTAESVFIFDLELDWIWTNASLYPFLFSFSRGAWLYYQPGSTAPRSFFDFNTKAWFSIPES